MFKALPPNLQSQSLPALTASALYEFGMARKEGRRAKASRLSDAAGESAAALEGKVVAGTLPDVAVGGNCWWESEY